MSIRPSSLVGVLLGLVATGLLVAGLAVLTNVGGPGAQTDATLGGSLLGFGILVAIGALVVGLRAPERVSEPEEPL